MVANERDDQDTTPAGLAKLAREAMDECHGDRDAAVALLWSWFREDRALYERLIEPLIEDGLYAAVGKVDRDTRAHLRVVGRVAPNPDRGAAGIAAMVERTMLDWPLPGGKRLGDAGPADLLHAARYYRTQEASARRDARWYELIHEAMHGGSRVEAVLSDAALARLRQRAEEEV